MNNSEKILKSLSSLIENGILTSKDIKKEISTDLKFQKDKLISKLDLVTREEFEILKKIVQKQDTIIKKITGPFLILSKLFIHFTLLSKIFFFCILFKNLLSSYKKILN